MHSDPQRALGELNRRGHLLSSNLASGFCGLMRELVDVPAIRSALSDAVRGVLCRPWWKARSADRSGRRMTFERVAHYYHGGHRARTAELASPRSVRRRH
jgi:hypothetical protein